MESPVEWVCPSIAYSVVGNAHTAAYDCERRCYFCVQDDLRAEPESKNYCDDKEYYRDGLKVLVFSEFFEAGNQVLASANGGCFLFHFDVSAFNTCRLLPTIDETRSFFRVCKVVGKGFSMYPVDDITTRKKAK